MPLLLLFQSQTEAFLYVEEQIDVEYDDSPELLQHLRRVSPLMCEQLERNANSRAFEILDNRGQEEDPGICLEYKFSHEGIDEDEPVNSLAEDLRRTSSLSCTHLLEIYRKIHLKQANKVTKLQRFSEHKFWKLRVLNSCVRF